MLYSFAADSFHWLTNERITFGSQYMIGAKVTADSLEYVQYYITPPTP